MTSERHFGLNGGKRSVEDSPELESSKKIKVDIDDGSSSNNEEKENKELLEAAKVDELDEIVNEYVEKNESVSDGFTTEYIPTKPQQPVMLTKNPETGKYVFPTITKEDSLNARYFLKYYGSAQFLDSYLPEDLNSLYVFHLIKLLGFQLKDRELLAAVQKVVFNNVGTSLPPPPGPNPAVEKVTLPQLSSGNANQDDTYDDPLEKRHAVRLIKDLQKAMNKVLSTRIRLTNFFTLDHFIAKLKSANKILVLTGAGISTSLGIPDFRSSKGFYSQVTNLGLEDPQDVFNLDIFMENPSVFYTIAEKILPPEHRYSPLHSFIRMIQDKGKLLRNYTQNIDNLESYAGIEKERIVQCHGSFATASCVTCHLKMPGERIFPQIKECEIPLCAYCYPKRQERFPTITDDESAKGDDNSQHSPPLFHMSKSFGVIKPDITFFGEALPSEFHSNIREDVLQCDLLICIGTSLKVAPVSEIVNMVPANVPQVLINRDPVKHAEFDLSLLGLCDDVAALIASKCGWDIPHESWSREKAKKFACDERERGVYYVYDSTKEK
ncbi:HBR160Wp [Eremothecium sinecaudum]|uniref:HBR160Wp n=1 Tax=Eremothecium sinecaudum TaxID=45286 RepID=A0A109UWX0_9SACH|nr:HBR160Wp [Eremothecium sinecaudum]AMD19061.1 HBR160Wp [Eremothecium sinecaudum]